MSQFPNASEETAALQRREAMETRPQDRYAGRSKFEFCRQCGSQDGMQAVHRETLVEMPPPVLNWIKSQRLHWYREPGNSEYLFYPCLECNRERITSGFVIIHDILDWLNHDPIAPDYGALAHEEPVSQIEDSRDSAGI